MSCEVLPSAARGKGLAVVEAAEQREHCAICPCKGILNKITAILVLERRSVWWEALDLALSESMLLGIGPVRWSAAGKLSCFGRWISMLRVERTRMNYCVSFHSLILIGVLPAGVLAV